MTLNTGVYVLSEGSPHEVFWKCRELLGAQPGLPHFDEPSSWRPDHWDLRNPGGVGLDAWLWLYYRPGAMLRATAEEHDDYCEDDCDGRHHEPPHWFSVTFDTAYSYKDDQGRGCGALHASLVARLGEWLDGRGIRWAWQNEFTGELLTDDEWADLRRPVSRLFDMGVTGEQQWPAKLACMAKDHGLEPREDGTRWAVDPDTRELCYAVPFASPEERKLMADNVVLEVTREEAGRLRDSIGGGHPHSQVQVLRDKIDLALASPDQESERA